MTRLASDRWVRPYFTRRFTYCGEAQKEARLHEGTASTPIYMQLWQPASVAYTELCAVMPLADVLLVLEKTMERVNGESATPWAFPLQIEKVGGVGIRE